MDVQEQIAQRFEEWAVSADRRGRDEKNYSAKLAHFERAAECRRAAHSVRDMKFQAATDHCWCAPNLPMCSACYRKKLPISSEVVELRRDQLEELIAAAESRGREEMKRQQFAAMYSSPPPVPTLTDLVKDLQGRMAKLEAKFQPRPCGGKVYVYGVDQHPCILPAGHPGVHLAKFKV
jgi:hypothetical protein